jgi:transposase-like protein
MPDELLTAREAARRLGVTTATLYGWLGQSDRGLLVIRGQPVTATYLQGGPRGRGRIRVEAAEVERLKQLMRVTPRPDRLRRPPTRCDAFPGIHVPLGRPDQPA